MSRSFTVELNLFLPYNGRCRRVKLTILQGFISGCDRGEVVRVKGLFVFIVLAFSPQI